MEKKIEAISEEVVGNTKKNIKIKFNKYAIEKYGCNKMCLNSFY